MPRTKFKIILFVQEVAVSVKFLPLKADFSVLMYSDKFCETSGIVKSAIFTFFYTTRITNKTVVQNVF